MRAPPPRRSAIEFVRTPEQAFSALPGDRWARRFVDSVPALTAQAPDPQPFPNA